MNLILTDPQSKLSLLAGRYRLQRKGEVIADWPVEQIDDISLLGPVQITTQAMRDVLRRGGELHILTQHDHYLGRLSPPGRGNLPLLRAQILSRENTAFALMVAQRVVELKLGTARAVLQKLTGRNNTPEFANAIKQHDRTLAKIVNCEQLEALRGLEGIAARTYFSALKTQIPKSWAFETRTGRDAKDPVNALLNLGYMMLVQKAVSALEHQGLHSGFGYLHEPNRTRPALALDLIENFRAPIVDRLVLTVTRRNIIKTTDFIATERGLHLNRDALTKFLTQLETRFAANLTSTTGKASSYKQLMAQQAAQLVQSIRSGIVEIDGFQLR